MPGLIRARQALDERLNARSARPLCVGFSGGGDSLFLLRLVLDWARPRGRSVIALHVDHGIHPASGDWARHAKASALRLGAEFRGLVWADDKPLTGLSAAARQARHSLLADATRQAGAQVLLLGHTADDVLEAELMALEGGSVGSPRLWAPSPVWPSGREVFLLRPLLGLRRVEIRAHLVEAGESWIEDPANESDTSPRIKARRHVLDHPSTHVLDEDALQPAVLAAPRVGGDGASGLRLDWPLSPTSLGMACLSAGGGERPPRRDRLIFLWEYLERADHNCATLCGAQIERQGEGLTLMRNAGEMARAGLPPLEVQPGEVQVWDGRFEILTDREGLVLQGLAGQASQLPREQLVGLKPLLPMARRSLPLLIRADGTRTCPILAEEPGVQIRDLVSTRLRAACGLIRSEA